MSHQIMSEEDFERLLRDVRSRASGTVEGVFHRNSITWKINRESAILLGAGRALLLQLAHPFVSTAIAEHSTVLDDPIGRFHRTFALVFRLVFGTLDQAVTAARRLHRDHARISGTLKSNAGCHTKGSPYSAADVPARLWVYATLTDTALLTYELVFGALGENERDQYYEESKLLAALCGIPFESLPADWEEFTDYFEEAGASDMLSVTDGARRIARRMLRELHPWLPVPSWYRALTTHLLPSHLRKGFNLPYGPSEQRSVEQAMKWMRRMYPLLPDWLRYVGPYHEAVARIEGRPQGLLIRGLNRFWIGESSLPRAVDQ